MLERVAHYANDVIVVFSLDGRLIEANDRFFDFYGYSRESLPHLTLSDLRSQTAVTAIRADLDRVTSQGHFTFETEHRRCDGAVFPVEVSSRLVHLDGGSYAVSVIRDISEIKAAMGRIQNMTALLQTATAVHHHLLHANHEQDVFSGVCRASTQFGLKMAWIGVIEGEAVRPVSWSGEGSAYLDGLVILLDPRDCHAWGPTGTAIRFGKPVVSADFQNDPATAPWHERGQLFGWKASAAFPLFRYGQVYGALTLYAAESGMFGPAEQTLLEDLAANVSFKLDQLDVRAQNAELQASLQESLQKLLDVNVELERFSEIYSHDLQEPVRNVVSFTQFLERRLTGKFDAETEGLLRIIVDAARRIRQLNFDLLDFSRSRHSQTALIPTDSGAALRDACDTLQASLEQSGGQVHCGPLPEVLGNPAELRQVFLALLSNAIKFATPGRRPQIEVAAEAEGEVWHFTVRDNGIGIESAYLDKVFTVFFRLHARPDYPGSGVGLAISRKIIERHGGTIWLESPPGQGVEAHFRLYAAPSLPALQEGSVPETRAVPPDPLVVVSGGRTPV